MLWEQALKPTWNLFGFLDCEENLDCAELLVDPRLATGSSLAFTILSRDFLFIFKIKIARANLTQ